MIKLSLELCGPRLPASAGGVLIRPHDRRVDHQPFEIGLAR
jgi:hypothetical protein